MCLINKTCIAYTYDIYFKYIANLLTSFVFVKDVINYIHTYMYFKFYIYVLTRRQFLTLNIATYVKAIYT